MRSGKMCLTNNDMNRATEHSKVNCNEKPLKASSDSVNHIKKETFICYFERSHLLSYL